MAGLQRSAVSFRRQGSSGHVWDDKFLGELIQASNNQKQEKQQQQIQVVSQENITTRESVNKQADQSDVKPVKIERCRSNGGGQRSYRTGKVSPAVEPPSPKVSACGFCAAFGKEEKRRRKKSGKGRSR